MDPTMERMETERSDLARRKNVTKHATGLAILDSVTARWYAWKKRKHHMLFTFIRIGTISKNKTT